MAVAGLLHDEEIGTLATIDGDGSPAASTMHIASDGFSVYMHTFTYNRKYAEMLENPRVSYAVTHLGSYEERFQVYSLQVKGWATSWLADIAMYDNVKNPATTPSRSSSGSTRFRPSGPTTACGSCGAGSSTSRPMAGA